MLETETRLKDAILAFRKAISKLVSFSLCLPTPLVKNIFDGTYKIRTPYNNYFHHQSIAIFFDGS